MGMFRYKNNFFKINNIKKIEIYKRSLVVVESDLGNTWPSRLGLYNTPTATLQRGKTPPTSVLGMTLNNLMVRFL